ncbi:hypothetical protein CAPTEDRAFT_43082, partial [Capitella teleta]
PITFTEKGAYVTLPMWELREEGSIEFNFKTQQRDAMIFYNGGQAGSRDFVAIELFDGTPYFVIDTGSGERRLEFSRNRVRVDDGEEHFIKVDRHNADLEITLDDNVMRYNLAGRNQELDLGTSLYLGAVNNPNRLPWHMWTRKEKFFLGCIWGMKINDGDIDLPKLARDQNVRGVEEECADMAETCSTAPCSHGLCFDRPEGFFCDCSDTMYTGLRCNERAPVATFDGKSYILINIDPTLETHTNDISLRFKTHSQDGLLFETSTKYSDDYLKAYLQGGRGRLETNLGGQSRVFRMTFECEDHPLNDDEWHTLRIARRANHFETWVDDCKRSTAQLPGEGYTLDIDRINIGSDRVSVDHPYIGHLQNLHFDDHPFFEYLPPGFPPNGIDIISNVNVSINPRPLPIYPITYRSKDYTYVALPTLEVFGNLDLKFMFKTREKDGLLFYNDGEGQDFLAIELVSGFLHFLVDDGSGPTAQVAESAELNDNEWHMVHVLQTSPHSFEINVDGVPTNINLRRTTNRFDLSGLLYVGGVREDMSEDLPYFINSRRSFVGCLATLKVNGHLKNLYMDAVEKSTSTLSQGCSGMSVYTRFCTPGICQHYGVCIEGTTTHICDCNMTSYVGRHCSN